MVNSKIKCLSRCGFIDRCIVAQYQYGNCLLYSNTTFSITQLNNAPGAIIYQKSAKITRPSTNPKTFLTSSEATNSVSYTTYGAACSVLTPCQGLSCIYGFCQCSSGYYSKSTGRCENCPTGWTGCGSKCYIKMTSESFEKAKLVCVGISCSLITYNDTEPQRSCVNNLWTTFGLNDHWLNGETVSSSPIIVKDSEGYNFIPSQWCSPQIATIGNALVKASSCVMDKPKGHSFRTICECD